MVKITDIESALGVFEESSLRHSDATEVGDYKAANKNYDSIVEATSFLKKQNAIDSLIPFLKHNFLGVRLWAASYLLPSYEKEATKTLQEISLKNGIHSLTAKTTLSEWQKGNLKL